MPYGYNQPDDYMPRQGTATPAVPPPGGYQPSFTPSVATPGGNLSPLDMQRQTLFSPAAGASVGQLPDFRNQQQGAIYGQEDFLRQLQARALGQGGPSPAELQLQRSRDANNANAASSIASVRGMNPAIAARQILDTQAQNNQATAGQAGVLRAQEQLAATGQVLQGEGQLAGSLGGARGQDVSQALGLGALQNQQTGIASNASQADTGVIMNTVGAGLSAAGSAASSGAAMAAGGPVPGRAAVAGDSPRNDTVPAELSPKEIVLPRSVTLAEDAPERAAAFVRAIQRKHRGMASGGEVDAPHYGHVLRAQRAIDELAKAMKGGA